MPLVLLLALLAVIAAIVVVAAGRGGGLAPAEPDRSPAGRLPEGDLDQDALESLRFSVVFRGYRMDEVDAVVDRLSGELAARDRRIAELRSRAVPEA